MGLVTAPDTARRGSLTPQAAVLVAEWPGVAEAALRRCSGQAPAEVLRIAEAEVDSTLPYAGFVPPVAGLFPIAVPDEEAVLKSHVSVLEEQLAAVKARLGEIEDTKTTE